MAKVLNDMDLIYDFNIVKFNNEFIYYKIIFNGTPSNFLKSMNDSKSQLCPKCMYDPYVQGDDEKMTRVFKPNAKPGSKDGSWGFSK